MPRTLVAQLSVALSRKREELASRRAELRRLNAATPTNEQHLHAKEQMREEVEAAIDGLENEIIELEQEILNG